MNHHPFHRSADHAPGRSAPVTLPLVAWWFGVAAFFLLACPFWPLHAAEDLPPDYLQARARLEATNRDPALRLRRDIWLSLHDTFMAIYARSPGWTNRAAARYRAGLALEGLALWSGSKEDATRAARHFRDFVADHATSVLADDALFHKAAVERRARLRAESAATLRTLIRLYPQGDMAAKARERLALEPHIPLVLLDAGHGGRDPGTAHNGIVEKDAALDLTRRIGRRLAALGVRVAHTRTQDVFLTLEERCAAVRKRQADLFVSIHINAGKDTTVAGFETYVLLDTGKGTDLTAAENAFQGTPDTVGAAVAPQGREELSAASRKLADLVQSAVMRELRGKGYATPDRGVLAGPFFVLREAGVPAILVEAGYCTNEREAALLAAPKYRERLAEGIAQGILAALQP